MTKPIEGIDTFINDIRSALGRPLSEDTLRFLEIRSNDVMDAAEAFPARLRRTSVNPPQYPIGLRVPSPSHQDTSPHQHISGRLGPIPANPQNALNTTFLNDSYCYETEGTTILEDVPNHSPASAAHFMDMLIEDAHERRKDASSTQHDQAQRTLSRRSLYVLYGDRGCGKTFFLNHLLSRFSLELDKRKIIWVRVNVAELSPILGDGLKDQAAAWA